MEMKEKKFLTKEELKNMSIEDIATYKITLEQLSYDIDELIKKLREDGEASHRGDIYGRY